MDTLERLMELNHITNIKKPDESQMLQNQLDELMTYLGLTVRRTSDGVMEIVKPERPTGSYTAPIEWEPGMWVQVGVNEEYESDGWYVYDGLVQRCIKNGNPDTFTDTEYW